MPAFLIPAAMVGLAIVSFKLIASAVEGLDSLTGKMEAGAERNAARKTVQRLMEQASAAGSQPWKLDAPESWALFKGLDDGRGNSFKVGLLQLLAARVLILEVFFEDQTATQTADGIGEAVLRQGPGSRERLAGSLAAVYNLWESLPEPRTIRQLARQVGDKYGSLAGFTEYEVKPNLVKSGLYTQKEVRYQTVGYAASYGRGSWSSTAREETESRVDLLCTLTSSGQAARDELESRMAEVLRRLQLERPAWVREKALQALMTAAVCVAAGRSEPAEETEMQLIVRDTEPALKPAVARAGSTAIEGPDPVQFDWRIFDNFNLEEVCSAVDRECDTAEQNGDGDAGGDGDGGDGVDGGFSDGGDFGGGGD